MAQELGDDQAFEACTIGLWKSPATLCAHRNPSAGPRAMLPTTETDLNGWCSRAASKTAADKKPLIRLPWINTPSA